MKDPEIRLFGMKIALPEHGNIVPIVSSGDGGAYSDCDCGLVTAENYEEDEERLGRVGGGKDEVATEDEEMPADTEKDKASTPVTEELTDPEVLRQSDDNPTTPSINEEGGTITSPKGENDEGGMSDSQQKTLKKPDKIIPCPRCNSMDTKFCYYNNYNVNQPRHFCKNCQRYWTAGGTMRNVPVGAGRRKSKNSALHCRHITISEALQAARVDTSNGIHHPVLKTNGTVLSFGSDSPLGESMASILKIAEKKAPNGTRNGFYKLETKLPVSGKGGENCDDSSTGSCITTSNSMAERERNRPQEPMVQNVNGFPSQILCLPGFPWPCGWNSAVPMPAIYPAAFPMPILPAPYWNCSIPSFPWMSPPSLSTNQKPPVSGPNSQTLGKHSRNGEVLSRANPVAREPRDHDKPERSILVPKTLRIDDPDEAAKSSIWATLGISNDSISRRGGLFKAFQPKGDDKNQMATTSPVLQANPAALSRSLSFQETA